MNEKFADRLKSAREARKMSQTALAKRAGFQPSAISHFETGRRSPSFENLGRLADALKVTTDYLLGRTNAMTASEPILGALAKHAEQMTASDLELLESFAFQLAERNQKPESP